MTIYQNQDAMNELWSIISLKRAVLLKALSDNLLLILSGFRNVNRLSDVIKIDKLLQ